MGGWAGEWAGGASGGGWWAHGGRARSPAAGKVWPGHPSRRAAGPSSSPPPTCGRWREPSRRRGRNERTRRLVREKFAGARFFFTGPAAGAPMAPGPRGPEPGIARPGDPEPGVPTTGTRPRGCRAGVCRAGVCRARGSCACAWRSHTVDGWSGICGDSTQISHGAARRPPAAQPAAAATAGRAGHARARPRSPTLNRARPPTPVPGFAPARSPAGSRPYSPFNDAMSMEKRYFTSDLSMRS